MIGRRVPRSLLNAGAVMVVEFRKEEWQLRRERNSAPVDLGEQATALLSESTGLSSTCSLSRLADKVDLHIMHSTLVGFAIKCSHTPNYRWVLSTPTKIPYHHKKAVIMGSTAYQLSPFAISINDIQWFQSPFVPPCTCNFSSGI